VRYLHTSHHELAERGKFGPRTRHGIFVGYKVLLGGVWNGVYKVMDVHAFRDRTANTVTAVLETNGVNLDNDILQFPCEDGTVIGKLLGGEE